MARTISVQFLSTKLIDRIAKDFFEASGGIATVEADNDRIQRIEAFVIPILSTIEDRVVKQVMDELMLRTRPVNQKVKWWEDCE